MNANKCGLALAQQITDGLTASWLTGPVPNFRTTDPHMS